MPDITLDFKFSSPVAEQFFNCSKRNICWVSGYGAGKTYAACQKALVLMCKFPGYRIAIGRLKASELRRTTIQTFYKVCPPSLYDEKLGGKRVESLGMVDLINGSRVYFMHFDDYDQSALRSLEINCAIIDQAEEIAEDVYLTLDSRVGRWDNVTIPNELAPYLPTNEFTGRKMAPAYTILLANPPDEGEFSYLWQRYHPDSPEWQESYKNTHQFFESASGDNKALPKEVLQTMLSRDPEWVNRYVFGKFSRGEGAIHDISPLSLINTASTTDVDNLTVSPEWIQKNVVSKGVLGRSMDHGASSPTSCLWWAALRGGYYIVYQEYYQPGEVISTHRARISELSGTETYVINVADPAIFKKTHEKYGGFWTVASEYSDERISGPPLFWTPGDNNEFATRNRINELLRINPDLIHPVTGRKGSPRLFYLRRSSVYPFGCYHIIRETQSQKKALLDTVNGKPIYSDEREKSISDHAYDAQRYYVATHLTLSGEAKPPLKPNSFLSVRNRIKALTKSQYFDRYGSPFK
jgi:hypothetical protein